MEAEVQQKQQVVIGVLECEPCGELAYSSIAVKRPELAQPCPSCGARMALRDLIVGE